VDVAGVSATASYATWARALSARAEGFHETPEGRAWLDPRTAERGAGSSRSPAQTNTGRSRRLQRLAFGVEETAMLVSGSARFGTGVEPALLAILAAAWQRWSHEDGLFVDLEHHGREPGFVGVDVSRTVGWFTTIMPVRLRIPAQATPVRLLDEVARQLRAVPHQGIGYGVLRYLQAETAGHLAGTPQPEVAFNYLGHLDRPRRRSRFALSRDVDVPSRDPESRRTHLIEVGASISSGRLRVTLFYSRHLHRSTEIRALTGHFSDMLHLLLGEWQARG
jgi:non-ribosomal peptide synthase protein (TIGR01720 family)